MHDSMQALLHDLGYAHAIAEEIRRVAAALTRNPFDEDASAALSLLVFAEVPAARAALARAMSADISDGESDHDSSEQPSEAGIR